jgi:hypothetical protein
MKTIILLALLSAVALAAPATEFVEPEEVLVQSASEMNAQALALTSSVQGLQKQFHELQVQLKGKSGMQITPGVKKTIDTMVGMITGEIQPAIKQAAVADQGLVDAKMQAVHDLNEVSASTKQLLVGRANDLRAEISSHNKLAKEWKAQADAYVAQIAKYEKTVAEKTKTCCLKQDAGVPDIEYTPAYFVCDYTKFSGDQCIADADKELKHHVAKKLLAASDEYQGLKAKCTQLTADVKSNRADLDAKNGKCDSTASNCRAKASIVASDKPELEKDWANAKSEYERDWGKRKGDYQKTEQLVKSNEADRAQEWDSTQTIKCMLKNYQAGGKFDSASQKKCEQGISHAHLAMKYPKLPAALKWDIGKFDALIDTTGYRTHCDREENADEDADKRCVLTPQKPKPECKNHDVKDGGDYDDAEPVHEAAKPDKCKGMNVPFSKGDNGVLFTWASPCSGGCSKAVPQCGWGICSEKQWQGLPRAQMKKDKPCSSKIFDKKWGHCDPSNTLVRVEDGGYNELVFCFHG